jgi:hypothetical protein
MIDLTQLISLFDLGAFFKIVLLVLIGLYTLFVLILFIQARSLGKIMIIEARDGTPMLRLFALFYLIASISLFLAALVIL